MEPNDAECENAKVKQEYDKEAERRRRHQTLLEFIQAYRNLYGKYPPSVMLPSEIADSEPETLYVTEKAECIKFSARYAVVAAAQEPARVALLRRS